MRSIHHATHILIAWGSCKIFMNSAWGGAFDFVCIKSCSWYRYTAGPQIVPGAAKTFILFYFLFGSWFLLVLFLVSCWRQGGSLLHVVFREPFSARDWIQGICLQSIFSRCARMLWVISLTQKCAVCFGNRIPVFVRFLSQLQLKENYNSMVSYCTNVNVVSLYLLFISLLIILGAGVIMQWVAWIPSAASHMTSSVLPA